MVSDLKSIIDNHLPNVVDRPPVKKPTIDQVDTLADELIVEYSNPGSRGWYCGVINKYGISKVVEWRSRAKSGKYPGRLFTAYVNQAGGYRTEKKYD